MNDPDIKKTALNAIHRQSGARMVNFAGWEMPVQYAGPIPEHMAVRTRAGIFDVSHMGELEIKGPNAMETLQNLTCNDVSRLSVSQCQYTALTTPQGTLVDDLLIYRMASDHFLLCVNASNQEKDFQWIRDNALPNTEVLFRSNDFSQLAIQGPKALEILRNLTEINLTSMKYYWFGTGKFAGIDAIVSRTGYTGEDGFEIYCHPGRAEAVWTRIIEAGKPLGLEPAGLAARNTLRLEAKLLLYGDFIGRGELLKQRESGLNRILVGFEMIERGIARDHYEIERDGQRIGIVTSGSPAPFLKKNIGLAYLPIGCKNTGTEFSVIIRDKTVKAQVVPTPFYRRES
jgi:aminomethyltransferase